ncbi:hypothetical protein MTR67_026868 [Solanum verrucosum]|uniref:Uncharacterized protein n=1 Tax=Solanum verrucosum TaxID=315347 RepID=A0AAF0R3Q9_SOLVR|nr:hypothetical protein MTR67_026868 [Solanum verrucosum]
MISTSSSKHDIGRSLILKCSVFWTDTRLRSTRLTYGPSMDLRTDRRSTYGPSIPSVAPYLASSKISPADLRSSPTDREWTYEVFKVKYYPVSKKLNHKDRVNNFVALPRESVSSSWDRFTAFVRSVPNHRIDDESLKEYFYRGQDDNNKAVLDTIAGGSYGDCTYAQIAEKLERISSHNKAWSTRR